MRYVDGKPHSIDTVVLSTQHDPDQSEWQTKMKASFNEAIIEEIIKPVLPKAWLQDTKYPDQPDRPLRHRRSAGRLRADRSQDHRRHLRRRLPARRRRILRQRPKSKVDRSAAYAARYVAKNIVAAGIAQANARVQVAYAIGVAKPMNITVYTEGTGVMSDDDLSKLVAAQFDLRPKGIIQMLDLLRPIYQKTAAYGHFGREEPEFSWEATDKAAMLRDAAGLRAKG